MSNQIKSFTTIRRALGLALTIGLLMTAGCQRRPQTAAELAKTLPPSFIGELHLQGETEARHISIQARELSIRSEHVLEFNRVDYQLLDAAGGPGAAGEAHVRGTITAPGLAVHLETLDATAAGAEDAIRPETFTGQLSPDLQSVQAEWSTGLGQKATLTLRAAP